MVRFVNLLVVVVPTGVHHAADGAGVEDEVGLPQLQMELRIAPLLADKPAAPAPLGLPLLLRRGAGGQASGCRKGPDDEGAGACCQPPVPCLRARIRDGAGARRAHAAAPRGGRRRGTGAARPPPALCVELVQSMDIDFSRIILCICVVLYIL